MISTAVRGRARGAIPRSQRQRLARRLARAMAAAGAADSDLALSLVDDDEIRLLNRDYRHKDKPTDVLSFSLREGEAALPGAPLGDVVISVETASRQARAAARPLEAELLHLAVHGLAHLLGYDHATKREERVMFAFESALRSRATARGSIKEVERPPLQSR